MTQAPETVRYIAKCRTCARPVAFDAEVITAEFQGRPVTLHALRFTESDYDAGTSGWGPDPRVIGVLYLPLPDGRIRSRFDDREPYQRHALARVGLWCPDCDTQMTVTALTARFNAAAPCGHACRSATSSNCRCSCGGANHARAWFAAA